MAKNNSSNQDYTNNSDGWDLSGGTTKRKLTVTGGDMTLTGSGANTYTFPASTDTLVGRASSDTLTNKDITSSTNIFPTGMSVQQVSTLYSAAASGTTIIPNDDTIPQNTEGDQYMSQAITPKSATNTLIIEVTIFLSSSVTTAVMAVALFQDSTANAIAAVAETFTANSTAPHTIKLTYTMAAGTTSSTTFKVRAGAHTASTTTFNGISGSRLYGGIPKSAIVITEFKS